MKTIMVILALLGISVHANAGRPYWATGVSEAHACWAAEKMANGKTGAGYCYGRCDQCSQKGESWTCRSVSHDHQSSCNGNDVFSVPDVCFRPPPGGGKPPLPRALPSTIREYNFPDKPTKYALEFYNPGPVRNKTRFTVYSLDHFYPTRKERENGFVELDPKSRYTREFSHHTGGKWSFTHEHLGAVNVCP